MSEHLLAGFQSSLWAAARGHKADTPAAGGTSDPATYRDTGLEELRSQTQAQGMRGQRGQPRAHAVRVRGQGCPCRALDNFSAPGRQGRPCRCEQSVTLW